MQSEDCDGTVADGKRTQFMVSIPSLISSLIQHDFHFVHDGPIESKIGDKAECAIESGHDYRPVNQYSISGTVPI